MTSERSTPHDSGPVSCREALERVFEWLDGELDPELAREVGEHLSVCAGCFPVLSFERSFREALRRIPQGAPPSEDLRKQILASLESAGLRPPQ